MPSTGGTQVGGDDEDEGDEPGVAWGPSLVRIRPSSGASSARAKGGKEDVQGEVQVRSIADVLVSVQRAMGQAQAQDAASSAGSSLLQASVTPAELEAFHEIQRARAGLHRQLLRGADLAREIARAAEKSTGTRLGAQHGSARGGASSMVRQSKGKKKWRGKRKRS